MGEKHYQLEIQLRRMVTERVRYQVSHGVNISMLAKMAGISPSTISKLAYGETKYPRFHTILAMCHVLNIELALAPLNNVITLPAKERRR